MYKRQDILAVFKCSHATQVHCPIACNITLFRWALMHQCNSTKYIWSRVLEDSSQSPDTCSWKANPFTWHVSDRRVSICYGCRATLKPGSLIPPSPNDLIVASRQYRKYFKDGKQHTSPALSMVYYHANIACILLQCPGFSSTMLHVPPELTPFLEESHKVLLRRGFNIFLWKVLHWSWRFSFFHRIRNNGKSHC